MVMLRLPDVNMVGHGNASAILGRLAAAMHSTNGVMPDFAIDATAGSPDEWTTGGDDDSCPIHSARGTLSRWTAPRARSAAHPTGFTRTGLIRL